MTVTTDPDTERLAAFRAMHGYPPRSTSAEQANDQLQTADSHIRRVMVDLHDQSAELARHALRLADDHESARRVWELLDEIARTRGDLSRHYTARGHAGQDAICWRLLDEDGETT